MTSKEIVEWHIATFRNVTIKDIKLKLLEESAEVLCAEGDDLVGELADVAIVLIALIGRCGIDLETEVNKKMALNVQRGKDGRWAS